MWRISWTTSAKKAVSSKFIELIYGSMNAMSYGKLEKLEKAGKSVALLLHFVTDLQGTFWVLLNNINVLSRI